SPRGHSVLALRGTHDTASFRKLGYSTPAPSTYPCTFCSVAPIWSQKSYSRSAENIVDEMEFLNRNFGVDLFLFQDEFFVSGKRQIMQFCTELLSRRISVQWKAFGRVNLVDQDMMQAMADCGCVELRFGIESGSDRILQKIKKGFTAIQAVDVVSKAIKIFPRVDAFYIWGFPFETMEDFNQSIFQMVSLRMLGARILPSLLSLLPQTEIFRELESDLRLEFCPHLLPEFVFTGHEICHGLSVEIPGKYQSYFSLIQKNPELFPGFFHINLHSNVFPKLEVLRQFGFYPDERRKEPTESCGAHSPHPPEEASLATRVVRMGREEF
ncbi:MAG: radical SAM protein, partial [Deltaproteobacteria bacterium]|nr:radical SAM protein [Deltaproteobacteria bacterium]